MVRRGEALVYDNMRSICSLWRVVLGPIVTSVECQYAQASVTITENFLSESVVCCDEFAKSTEQGSSHCGRLTMRSVLRGASGGLTDVEKRHSATGDRARVGARLDRVNV